MTCETGAVDEMLGGRLDPAPSNLCWKTRLQWSRLEKEVYVESDHVPTKDDWRVDALVEKHTVRGVQPLAWHNMPMDTGLLETPSSPCRARRKCKCSDSVAKGSICCRF